MKELFAELSWCCRPWPGCGCAEFCGGGCIAMGYWLESDWLPAGMGCRALELANELLVQGPLAPGFMEELVA